MASPRASLLLAATLVFALASPSSAIDIIDLHKNTVGGTPSKAGNRFQITGIVTSPDGVRSDVSTDVVIQDATGGIDVFSLNTIGNPPFALGDSVTIEGALSHFNGFTELVSPLTGYVLHSTGNPVLDPLELTCAQVNSTFFNSQPDSFPEVNEGKFIVIRNCILVGAWPTTCANTSVTIQDATGTTTLFFDKDTELCGMPAPSGAFDVQGILAQFASAPYKTGYEIMPRYRSDIIQLTPGPNFLTTPTAVDVDSVSARIIWDTDVVSTSLVEYGLTTAYGSQVGDSTPVTSHSVSLTGLQAGKLYHFRVASTNGLGTRLSNDITFVTPSNTPGSMNFYFSKSVEPSYANPDTAAGNVFLLNPVLNRVNAAQHDISMAVYSFNIVSLADALIAAKNRGVKVRAIMDAGLSQTQLNRLAAAGIPTITSTYGGNHLSGGIHHNKFFIFDGRDQTSNTDDWVWTGSINMSNENMQDSNNGIEIQDYGLAQAYLTEFNEEWGSDTDTPNASLSRMGNRKSDNTPHHFVINGIHIDSYFSPSDGTDSKIVDAVNTADSTIYFSLYVYTSDPIEAAMRSRYTTIPGFDIRGVYDAAGANNTGSSYPDLNGSGPNPFAPPADVWVDNEGFTLHDKYAIIDEGRADKDPMVITGSHNWSASANTENDENTLIFHDARIANLYLQNFAARYHLAGGTGNLTVGVPEIALANGMKLGAPWPSPASRQATVEFTLPGGVSSGQRASLRLYDLQGRLVRNIFTGPAAAGPRRFTFPASGDDGATLRAGIYFLRLDALGESLNQKWVVLR